MAEGRPFRRLIEQAIISQRPLVLDTSALLEFFSGAGSLSDLVAEVLENTSIPIVHSTVTISEALVRPTKAGEHQLIWAVRSGLENRANTRVISFDIDQALETARVRAFTNLKLPDSAVVAVARTHNAIGIVGADRKWRTRELGVPFYYLPDMLETERG